nr:immunoglobulin light chain junction region [Macaca mulatta]MOV84166.1 immunoglobulin light chain junction region [Macaca mulatta]
CQHSYGFSYSF